MTTLISAPSIYHETESKVRSYCRSWPVEFATAAGSRMTDTFGREYIDFFAGAGALNYGHNPPAMGAALIEHIRSGGVTHGLDMHTVAKGAFLQTFRDVVLRPRSLDYLVQFTGPTGANAVEAALKLARKATGRQNVISFTNAFHGMSLGALAVTGNAAKRRGAGVPLVHSTPMPYDGYLGSDGSEFAWLEKTLSDGGSGVDCPAAVIVETVQAEGGLNAARAEWLRDLADLCRRHAILLIVDDIQMGVGRTGPFFSFEFAGITPDIVCLSKSISGFGLPMSLVLMRPHLDVWAPGEHNGTFRGNNHAFVTAREALLEYWANDSLERSVATKGHRVGEVLRELTSELGADRVQPRGRGLARGLRLADPTLATRVCAAAFEAGLLVETAGPQDEVVKLLPALTIGEADLEAGLDIVRDSVRRVAG